MQFEIIFSRFIVKILINNKNNLQHPKIGIVP